MALVAADLAEELKDGIGQMSSSAQILGFATAIVEHITMAGLVSHAPGTVVGVTAPGSPLALGAATGGIIAGLAGPALTSLIVSYGGYPGPTAQISGMADAIAVHLLTGIVNFAPGGITGDCTNTPVAPGPLVNGAGSGGLISGYVGAVLAAAIATGIGQPGPTTQVIDFSTNLVNYIMLNAEVTYATGTVTGVCPPGGGPLALGAGIGGTIA